MDTVAENAIIMDISLELFAVSFGLSVEKVAMISVNNTMHMQRPMKYTVFILT